MFDTMTLTKTAGALCGALLVFLLGNMAAGAIFSMGGGHGAEHAQGYVVDTGAGEAEEAPADAGPSLAERMAAADPANGEKLFRNCAACHAVVEGENKVGPYLYGVVGRAVGSVATYGSYSGALTAVAEVWTPVELYAFLENPKGYAPGTAMGYAGLRKSEDRADLIAYLDQTDGTTFAMPLEEAAVQAAPAEETADETVAADAAVEEPAAEVAAAAPAVEDVAAAEPVAEEVVTEQPAAEEPAAAEPAPAAAAAASGFTAMVAAADLAAGEKIFRRCAACHKVEDGKNGAGPHLFGVVGRDIASVEGFNYSDALKGLEGTWDVERLNGWIENPRAFLPANKMGFPGLKEEQDRANVIGYLQSVGN